MEFGSWDVGKIVHKCASNTAIHSDVFSWTETITRIISDHEASFEEWKTATGATHMKIDSYHRLFLEPLCKKLAHMVMNTIERAEVFLSSPLTSKIYTFDLIETTSDNLKKLRAFYDTMDKYLCMRREPMEGTYINPNHFGAM